jgi:hypothetical protein
MTDPSRCCYVYLFLRHKDSPHGLKYSPYYVGKGCRNRAYEKSGRTCPAPKDRSFIVFVQEGLTEEEAFSLERYCISMYGRIDQCAGILRNLTDGGEGVSGYKHLPETINRVRMALKGRPSHWIGRKHSLQARARMSESAKGRKAGEETKKKMSESRKGRKMSEDARQKLIQARTGQRHSEETRQKISRNRKGKATGENNSQYGKRKELNPNFGKPRSEEVRRKISEAHKGKKMGPQSQFQINKRITMKAKYLYELIDKNGEVYMTDNLQYFARQYGLTASCLQRLLKGTIKSYKGWQVRIAEVLK